MHGFKQEDNKIKYYQIIIIKPLQEMILTQGRKKRLQELLEKIPDDNWMELEKTIKRLEKRRMGINIHNYEL